MSLPRLQVDFVPRRGPAVLPMIIGICGALAVAATIVAYRAMNAEAAGLDARLAAVTPSRITGRGSLPVSPVLGDEARSIAKQLATPWGVVLDDLEAASLDSEGSIAVLAVLPDRDTHRVTLTAEARSLPAALKYVLRLQHSKSLLHPLLDSHEVRSDVAERPVRVQITAEWKLPS